jgi:hypothetical protein
MLVYFCARFTVVSKSAGPVVSVPPGTGERYDSANSSVRVSPESDAQKESCGSLCGGYTSATSNSGSSPNVAKKRTFGALSGRLLHGACEPPAAQSGEDLARGSFDQPGTSSFFEVVSGRNHRETWTGCIVSRTTPTSSAFSASRSVSSLSLAEKASRVLAASYFLR